MKVIDKFILPDGTEIQLEDWRMYNTKDFPNLYGYTIGCYPIAKNNTCFIRSGESFRLSISTNNYQGYTENYVLSDYEALKNGNKTIYDLSEHYYNCEKDKWLLGMETNYTK